MDQDPDPEFRIQEAQKHVDPGGLDPDSDPDPQHCSYVNIEFFRP